MQMFCSEFWTIFKNSSRSSELRSMFQRRCLQEIAWFTEISNSKLSKWQTNSGYVALRIDWLYLFWKHPEFLEMQIYFVRIMLIRILSFKNDSCIFFSSLEFLHFDFLGGDDGATTWTKFICNLSSLFYPWDVISRLSVGTVCSFKFIFPPANLNNETSFL